MKKIVIGMPLLLLLWLYLYLFTYFWRYPAIYIHLPQPDANFTIKMMDTDSGGGTYGAAGKEGVARLYPTYPPKPDSELFAFWKLKEPFVRPDGLVAREDAVLLKSEEINFCMMDIHLDEQYGIVDEKIDYHQGFDCLMLVLKRNLSN